MTEAEAVLFQGAAETVPATYRAIIAAVGGLGHVAVEAKKTSIHLVAGSAFAGVHPQKSKLRLNIRTDSPLESPRIRKVEKVSARRFHNELDLTAPAEVDDQVVAWLAQAYTLSAKA